jgi:hypothetical protein
VPNSELVIERYELKYRIPPALVEPIRAALSPYVRPDSASAHGPYTISSLYLDTANRSFYGQTMEQAAYRFKLRIRRYRTGPYFIECKARNKDVIVKTRVAFPAEAWPAIVLAPDGERHVRSPRDLENLRVFTRKMRATGAMPNVIVRYEREAFVSTVDDYARVTFDRALSAHAPRGWDVLVDGPGWLPADTPDRFGLPISGVVLELKCTTGVPLWMSDLVRRFGLVRTGFSKFCTCADRVADPLGLSLADRQPSRWLMRDAP